MSLPLGCFAVLLFISFPLAAHSQDGHLGHGHDKWHGAFYQNLKRPDAKGSCCNLTDCRPTSIRTNGDHYEVKVSGNWVAVPADKIVKETAPDLGAHVCAPYHFNGQPHQLYCVVLPPET